MLFGAVAVRENTQLSPSLTRKPFRFCGQREDEGVQITLNLADVMYGSLLSPLG